MVIENQINLAVQEDTRLTQSELLAADARTSLLGDFFRSAAYTGLQAPVDGLTQIADRVTGSNLQETFHKIDPPKPGEFLSGRWLVQQAGSAVGVLPWFIALHKGTSVALGRTSLVPNAVRMMEAGEALSARQAMTVHGFRAVESGVAGLVYGGLLTPSKPGEDLLASRMRHATSSALTFSTLSLASGGMRVGGEMLATRSPLAAGVLKNEAAVGLLSGVPAGLMSANSESLLAGKGLASLDENGKAVISFGLLGFGFGALSSRFQDQPQVRISRAEAKPQTKPLDQLQTGRTASSLLMDRPESALTGGQAKPQPLESTATRPTEPVRTGERSGTAAPAVELSASERPAQPPANPAEVARTQPAGNGSGAAENPSGRSTNMEPTRAGSDPRAVTNKAEVKKTVLDDGTLIIEKPDGMTITKYKNGDTKFTNQDGSVLNQANGWVIRYDRAGVEISRDRPKGRIPADERPFNVASMNVDPLAKAMSNLNQRPFVLDGIKFESVEGFYRWLQWSQDPAKAGQMPALFGVEARRAGKGCQFTEATFRGETFELGSPKHHEVIKLAIRESLRQNPELAQQFATTHPRPIIHNTGRRESANTKLPGTVFSRLLMEVRQEIVDGKLLQPERPAVPEAAMATPIETMSLSDAVARIRDRNLGQVHPLRTYAEAVRGLDMPVRSFLGGGKDALAFELGSGDVIKLTTHRMAPELGTRPFDAPILNRGQVSLDGGFSLNWFVQPRGQTPVPEPMVRAFAETLPPQFSFMDRKPSNFALINGELKLIDYWAVRRVQ